MLALHAPRSAATPSRSMLKALYAWSIKPPTDKFRVHVPAGLVVHAVAQGKLECNWPSPASRIQFCCGTHWFNLCALLITLFKLFPDQRCQLV